MLFGCLGNNRTFGNRTFSYTAPSVWNSLPREVKLAQSTSDMAVIKQQRFEGGFERGRPGKAVGV